MTDQKQPTEYKPAGFELGFSSVAAYRKLQGVALPETFMFCKIQHVHGGMLLEGSETTTFKSGPRKGKTKWIGERTSVVISKADTDNELLRYESETGKCWRCVGSGKLFKSWSKETGTEYRDCDKCAGSGNAL